MITWKKYFRGFYFEIGWHHGRKQYYCEVTNIGLGKILHFETYDTTKEAYNQLSTYGYHNIGRFILGD